MTHNKILVSEGMGYIGSHALKRLNDAGKKAIILDNLSTSEPTPLNPMNELIVGDIRDYSLIADLAEKHRFDAVMHFAALIDVEESMRRPIDYYVNNVLGSLNLLQVCADFCIDKFVFSSSAAVYGNPSSAEAVKESSPAKPISPYGRSKLMFEQALADATAQGISSVSLRYFNAVGTHLDYPGKRHPHMIPIAVRHLLDGKRFIINGTDYPTKDGTCVRDYVHVSDLAEAHLSALDVLNKKREKAEAKVYNLGTGEGYSVLEVVHELEKQSKKKMSCKFGQRRDGDPASLTANSSLAARELGWVPHFDLERIVRNELEYARRQK